MSEITVTLVNWYSQEYIAELACNLQDKASGKYSLRYLIIDNTNRQDQTLYDWADRPANLEIVPFSVGQAKGSIAHARALDRAMEALATPYSLIIDPDIYVFKQDWDAFCVNLLDRNEAVAVGAPYPVWKTGKYHDFPSPPFCFFRTEALQSLSSDWYPYARGRVEHSAKFAARMIGRLGLVITRRAYERFRWARRYSRMAEGMLGVFSPDTGWFLADEARRKGLKTIQFDAVLPGSSALPHLADTEPWQTLAGHYELFTHEDEPILTHKYGSAGWHWKTVLGPDKATWKRCIEQVETTLKAGT